MQGLLLQYTIKYSDNVLCLFNLCQINNWHNILVRFVIFIRMRRYILKCAILSTYSPIHAEGEYPNALCFFKVRGRAPTRNVWNTHVWSAHFRRSSYSELEPRHAEVWPCMIHTSYVSFTKSTKRTLMLRRPGKNTKLKSLAIYSIMNILYGLLYTDRYYIFIFFIGDPKSMYAARKNIHLLIARYI